MVIAVALFAGTRGGYRRRGFDHEKPDCQGDRPTRAEQFSSIGYDMEGKGNVFKRQQSTTTKHRIANLLP
jgi:hypothetical protein